MNIRIASYNLWWHKAYPELPEVAKDQKPTILCLQECYPKELKDKLGTLTLAGAHRYVHRATEHKQTTPQNLTGGALIGNVGLALYYDPKQLKLDSLERLQLPLPWQERNGGRIAQVAHFTWIGSGEKCVVVNVHLSALLAPNRARRQQLQEILEWLAQQGGMAPTILAGDFNYPIAPSGLRKIMKQAGFVECGTSHTAPTHVSKLVKGKFDRIFISHNLKEHDYHVLPFGLSDHAPIAATVSLT
jgi:endonuclease/exonuclease/phosphatase family metal-dependent hydrolase